jgi:hypothetical protein
MNKKTGDQLSSQEIASIINKLTTQCEYKEGVNPKDWHRVDLNLLIVADYCFNFCQERGIKIVFTYIIGPKISQSKEECHTEAERRAFDIRTKGVGFTTDDIDDLIADGSRDLAHVAAIGRKSGKPNPFYFHLGTEEHIHGQSKRRIL